jgi:peptidyl-prolyl cis-trans isomerase C
MGLAVLALSLIAAFGCSKKQSEADQTEPFTGDSTTVVATVNGESILLGEVNRVVGVWKSNNFSLADTLSPRALQRKALDELVDQRVLLDAARKEDLVPTEEQMQMAMKMFMQRFQSPEMFEQALQQQGSDRQEFEKNLRVDMTIRNYLFRSMPDTFNVAAGEAQRWYDDHPDMFTQVHARHILVKVEPGATPEAKDAARTKAHALLSQVRGGADFGETAKASSDCPSAPNGGDLGTFGKGQMVPAFEEAAFGLQEGQVSDVVETQFGYHIIKLEGRSKMPFDQNVEGQLSQQIVSEKRSAAVRNRIDDLRSAAKIEKKI